MDISEVPTHDSKCKASRKQKQMVFDRNQFLLYS